ncbi:MAG: TRAP transporter small permease [Cytophagales bacterium]|nr:TRAP transporter small permease [Rhizobacter sp.]
MRRHLERVAQAVAATLFALLFLTFVLQVGARFLFDRPLAWSDELVVILYIAMVFWSAAVLLKEREHVMFDLVYAALPKQGQRVMALLGAVLMAGLMGVLLPYAFDYVRFMHREPTAVLGVPFSIVFAPFLLFVLAMVVMYLRKAWRLLSRDWEQAL